MGRRRLFYLKVRGGVVCWFLGGCSRAVVIWLGLLHSCIRCKTLNSWNDGRRGISVTPIKVYRRVNVSVFVVSCFGIL